MEKSLHEGIVLVDKPTGVSSHAVVNWARRCSGIKKIGHTGTLDPLATGLLILLVGRKYTQLQSQYLKQDKEYICTARLGVTTDSYDVDGVITSQAQWNQVLPITKHDIEQVMSQFKGEIEQTVPIFSAVKQKGKKLYELARSGQGSSVTLPSRKVKIFSLELLELVSNFKKNEVTVSFKVQCSSGTYIRSLAHDIGIKLGVGATVTALRRTKIGELSIDQAWVCPVVQRAHISNGVYSKNYS